MQTIKNLMPIRPQIWESAFLKSKDLSGVARHPNRKALFLPGRL